MQNLIQEGQAQVLTKHTYINSNNQTIQEQVFYNPVQVFNRDLSVLAIQAYIDYFKKQNAIILDGLSASGLRAIRYIKEISGIDKVYANDLSIASKTLIE